MLIRCMNLKSGCHLVLIVDHADQWADLIHQMSLDVLPLPVTLHPEENSSFGLGICPLSFSRYRLMKGENHYFLPFLTFLLSHFSPQLPRSIMGQICSIWDSDSTRPLPCWERGTRLLSLKRECGSARLMFCCVQALVICSM